MYVKHTRNNLSKIKEEAEKNRFLKGFCGGCEGILRLTIGNTYVVYCVEIHEGGIMYYICEPKLWHPTPYPDLLFDIVDGRPSRYWSINDASAKGQFLGKRNDTVIAFDEWRTDEAVYKKLVDHKEHETIVFHQYKQKTDLECPDPSVSLGATNLEGNWVMCPECCDAWEAISEDGMTTCPQCLRRLLNPKFKD